MRKIFAKESLTNEYKKKEEEKKKKKKKKERKKKKIYYSILRLYLRTNLSVYVIIIKWLNLICVGIRSNCILALFSIKNIFR